MFNGYNGFKKGFIVKKIHLKLRQSEVGSEVTESTEV